MASDDVLPAASGAFHVRSISLPSRSHPLCVRVEEGLHKLKTWATSELAPLQGRASSSPTAELLCTGLQALEEMHECVEELLLLPRTRRALARRRRGQHDQKWAAEELDGSVRLLDVCQTARDAVSSIKEQAQGLQSALRTRRSGAGELYSDGKFHHAFVQSRKQAHKEGNRCSKALKHIVIISKDPAACDPELPDEEGSDHLSLASILKAVKDLREITVVVLRSTACFLIMSKPSSRRWFSAASSSTASTTTHEFERVEASLRSIQRKHFEIKVVEEEARRGLQSLEVGMGGLETCLDSMFRRLIQNRVSLLNILSP